jgi:hypothetical protein
VRGLGSMSPRKVKGRRELLNLECSINYGVKGASSRRGERQDSRFLVLSALRVVLGFVVLWVLGLRACRVCGFVGVLAVSFKFLLLIWSLLCRLHVYLRVPYAF